MDKNKSKAYWKENISYLFILLAVWFLVSFVAGIILKDVLNDFKLGGLITSLFALIIGGLWVSTISQLGIFGFVNTLGAVLAPIYGIMMVDYYMLKKGKLNIEALFTTSKKGIYYYDNGWNKKAMVAFVIPAIFSVATVWIGALGFLSGFSWVIGAALGGIVYYSITKK